MINISIRQLHRVIGGRIHADEDAKQNEVCGLTWDSRNVKEKNIFLAMPGERVDGNDFIVQAVYGGAGAVICTKEPPDATLALAEEFVCPVIWVNDAQRALNKLARYWRSCLHAIVVGISGSTGKTSTKNYVASVLSQRFKVCATKGNHNNELGVPATILSAPLDCEVLVVEMGMRGLGQIEQLCNFVQPTLGLITNVGVCHMELLGSRENIALAKSELLASLPAAGTAFVNADDDVTQKLLDSAKVEQKGVEVKRFGLSDASQYKALNIRANEDACFSFDLCLPKEQVNVQLSQPGKHNVQNALAAAAVGDALGVKAQQIAIGLSAVVSSDMRTEIKESAAGFKIINDAYNANPDSMKASLDVLQNLSCSGRRYAVLGDMGELGAEEVKMHEGIGGYVAKLAAASRLDELICVGKLARNIAKGAENANMNQSLIKCFDTNIEAIEYMKSILEAGDIVLLKASRFMGFENIAKELLSE